MRLGKYTRTAAVKHSGDFSLVLRVNNQRRPKKMLSGPQGAVGASSIHVRQPLAHIMTWDHGHVLDAKGQKDVLLQVVVEGQTRCTFQCDSRPVDANLPH